MATYTDPTTLNIAHKKFVTVQLVQALVDNPLAQQEVNSGAPWPTGVWHPYDSTEVGDGNDGQHFDFATDGAAADPLTTPNFADKYEYRWHFNALQYNVIGTGDTVDVQAYNETAATWTTILTINPGTANADDRFFGYIIAQAPRILSTVHRFEFALHLDANLATDQDFAGTATVFSATPFVVGNLRLNNSPTRNWNAGSAELWRRRVSG